MLRQQVIAIRPQLRNLTGQTVQNLQRNLNAALSLQTRIERENAQIQTELDLTNLITALQSEIARRLAPPPPPVTPPVTPPPVAPVTPTNPDEAGNEEEEEEEEEEVTTPTISTGNLGVGSGVIIPLPRIIQPVGNLITIEQFSTSDDGAPISRVFPTLIEEVLTDLSLTQFLARPQSEFYAYVTQSIEAIYRQSFSVDDYQYLNPSERSRVDRHNALINNLLTIRQSFIRTNDIVIVERGNSRTTPRQPSLPNSEIWGAVLDSLRSQGFAKSIRLTSTLGTGGARYTRTTTWFISELYREIALDVISLRRLISPIVLKSHVRNAINLDIVKQQQDLRRLSMAPELTDLVSTQIANEIQYSNELIRYISTQNLKYEEYQLENLLLGVQNAYARLSGTISTEQEEIMTGLSGIGDFFTAPLHLLGGTLTALFDPTPQGIAKSLVNIARAQRSIKDLTENPSSSLLESA